MDLIVVREISQIWGPHFLAWFFVSTSCQHFACLINFASPYFRHCFTDLDETLGPAIGAAPPAADLGPHAFVDLLKLPQTWSLSNSPWPMLLCWSHCRICGGVLQASGGPSTRRFLGEWRNWQKDCARPVRTHVSSEGRRRKWDRWATLVFVRKRRRIGV